MPSSPTPTPVQPPGFADVGDAARLADALRSTGFDETALCDLLGIDSVAQALNADAHRLAGRDEPPAVMARLFVLLDEVPTAVVEAAIGSQGLALLHALGLVRTRGADCVAAALLAPLGGLFVASDRHRAGPGMPSAPDGVYPGIAEGTLRFLRTMPRAAVEDAIDIGSGSGVAALVLAERCRRVVATDITERACAFIRFNAALNRRTNIEVVAGDCYAPVAGRTFDLIVSHPPYVPALTRERVYRDAGETGEDILRRFIAGAPGHLKPAGTCIAVSAGWDAADGAFEQRIRRWLGEGSAAFDVVFAQTGKRTPAELAQQLAERPDDEGDAGRWLSAFAAHGLGELVYGAIAVLRRAQTDGPPVTLRGLAGIDTDGEALARAAAVRRASGDPAVLAALPTARPRLEPTLRVVAEHRAEHGRLVPVSTVLSSQYPLPLETRVDAWMPAALSLCAGATVSEVHQAAVARGIVPETCALADFTRFVAGMLDRGFLRLDP